MNQPTATTNNPMPANLARALAQGQLPGLDALRALAAFSVVFYHGGLPVPGDLGVLSFFVLSGFLITWLLVAEWEKYGNISLKLFYLRRSLRIFPAFYVYWLLIVWLLALFNRNIVWSQAWSSFFYVNNYYQAINGHIESGFSHTWSLGVEEQFYLLWPFALAVLFRKRARLEVWLAAAIGLVWVWRFFLEFGVNVHQTWMYEAFDARADHLLIGCLLAVVLRQRRGGALWSALCAHPVLPAVTLALLVAEVAWSRASGGAVPRSVEFILQPLLVAAIMVQWMAFAGSGAWRWLNWPWLVYLGKISYSIYLYQQVAPSFVRPLASLLPEAPRLVFTVPATIALASASYYFVEKPFLKLKERYGQRKLASPPAVRPPKSERAA